jgi:hypothetical protein
MFFRVVYGYGIDKSFWGIHRSYEQWYGIGIHLHIWFHIIHVNS